MTVYPIGQNIPLFFVRVLNGALVSGLSVSVEVQNAITGAVLLSSTPLTEVSPGVYSYNWGSGLMQFTQCIEIYSVNGQDYVNSFSVANLAGTGPMPQGAQELIGLISQPEQLVGTLQPEQQIDALIQTGDTIEGNVSITQNVEGEILDDQMIEGTIEE